MNSGSGSVARLPVSCLLDDLEELGVKNSFCCRERERGCDCLCLVWIDELGEENIAHG